MDSEPPPSKLPQPSLQKGNGQALRLYGTARGLGRGHRFPRQLVWGGLLDWTHRLTHTCRATRCGRTAVESEHALPVPLMERTPGGPEVTHIGSVVGAQGPVLSWEQLGRGCEYLCLGPAPLQRP